MVVRIASSVYRRFRCWYRYTLMVVQISYAKQEESKREEESYSNIN
jgi:hypothetical protein